MNSYVARSMARAGAVDCAVVGVELKKHVAALPAFEVTTGVFVSTTAAESFKRFFTARLTDPMVAICLDAPGTGKTTTVEHTAAEAEVAYIRFGSTACCRPTCHVCSCGKESRGS